MISLLVTTFLGEEGEQFVGRGDNADIGHGGSGRQRAATGGNGRQRAVAGGNGRQWAATGGNERQWAATGGNGRQRAEIGGGGSTGPYWQGNVVDKWRIERLCGRAV